MKPNDLSRRQILAAASTGSLNAVASRATPACADAGGKAGQLAVLGGQPEESGAGSQEGADDF